MSETVIAVKKCIVVAYEIVSFGMYSLDERKTQLLEVWNRLVDIVKESEDLNTFEIVFISQKALGDILIDFKDLTEGVRVFKSLKILCEDF